MRISNLRLWEIVTGIALLAYGCGYDYPYNGGGPNYNNPPNNNGGNYNSSYYNITEYQNYRNQDGLQARLNQGTFLYIPANAFIDTGTHVLRGEVDLTIKEIYHKSDMFLSALSTQADSGLFQSGGMLYISAAHSNSPVTLKSGTKIMASFPVSGQPLKMQVLNGVSSPYGFTAWKPATDTAANYVLLKKDSTGRPGYFYNMYASGLNWLGCGNFVAETPSASLKLSLANGASYSGVTCALVYGFNSETMMVPDTGTNNFMLTGMPIGQKATIVVYAQKGGATYSAFLPVTLSASMTEKLTLSPTTTGNFRNTLKGLD